MRKIYTLIFFSLLLGCQTEEDTQIINSVDGLNRESILTGNIKRLTQNPTTLDNFIDGSSKIKVEFPAELIINEEINFTLQSFESYFSLIEILEDTPQIDSIELVYPVVVSKIDYSQHVLNSANELAQLLENSEASSEVECLEFVFPLSVKFFDASNTFINTITLSNKAQFFNFLEEVDENNLFYEIIYPIDIDVEIASSQPVTISLNSNQELNDIYSDLSADCFEPLLYENNPSEAIPYNLNNFIAVISQNQFQVSQFIDEGEQDNSFSDFIFSFTNEDIESGSILVDNDTVGTWSAFLDDEIIVFDLSFNNSDFDDLEEDWDVLNFNENTINLIDESSDGDNSSLILNVIN